MQAKILHLALVLVLEKLLKLVKLQAQDSSFKLLKIYTAVARSNAQREVLGSGHFIEFV